MPDYDTESFDRTRRALLALASDMTSFERSFGRPEDVDPVHHLIGAAAGWGGLPDAEATYVGVSPGLPVGEYELTVRDVPVDGFWSISVDNADGFFEPNESGAYSVNNITAAHNADRSVTFDSVAPAIRSATHYRSPRAGTTWCASAAHAPRSSADTGPSLPLIPDPKPGVATSPSTWLTDVVSGRS
jgi:hypothetical protein